VSAIEPPKASGRSASPNPYSLSSVPCSMRGDPMCSATPPIESHGCDAVSMARPLVANNDLPQIFKSGKDRADKPCSYCNRCLVNVVENPLGCYDATRFPTRDAMIAQIMSVKPGPSVPEQAASSPVIRMNASAAWAMDDRAPAPSPPSPAS